MIHKPIAYLSGVESQCDREIKISICTPRVNPQMPQGWGQKSAAGYDATHNEPLTHN